MSKKQLLFGRWVVPVEPADCVYLDHCVVVEDGIITDVLPSAEARTKHAAVPEGDRFEGGKEHVLLPGFVNCHTHSAMTLLRGIADDLPLMPWLTEHVWPAEGKFVSPEFVADGTRVAIVEMLKGGTTTFNDMYFFPDEIAKAADESGMRAVVGLICIGFPSAYCGSPDNDMTANIKAYLAKGVEINDNLISKMPLVTTIIAPHAPYTCGRAGLQHCKDEGDRLGLGVHIHLCETGGEVKDWKAANGDETPIGCLDSLGMIQKGLVAVHMTNVEDKEMDRLASESVSVVHCPESNMKLASGACQVACLLKKGVNVAIGTDGCASNNDLDMYSEMHTAALLGKHVAADSTAVPAAQAIRMATLGGAKALGLDKTVGSLEVGKAADIQAVSMGGIESAPLYDVLSHLAYCTGRQQVSDVWVAGKRIVNGRVVTTLDEEDLRARAHAWGDKIQKSNLHTMQCKRTSSK
eukprot:CAMPEP_0173407878 /NCGR_PEP_ID=MMETSP1356-20130122/68281_1 /TAXON_ID=77927 ORGANISM="Hemiselmis virescens, Strain PCC157" /NCGR_SAMPLE_ID=MMETSP1356 /ASSEMBLY_ACC=CAM_ASM_000847 /LENGTH=464 /DNA_ID=CAMNT_0014369107 /DNA_START=84 /DNA_END=1478 /DNA_ORIENTATION=-